MDLPEYQLLKKLSGLLEDELKYFIRGYMVLNNTEHLPTLDEIPGANSENYIREFLGLSETSKTIDKDKLFEITGTKSIKDAMVSLNRIFLDKKINLLELNQGILVSIVNRPKVSGEFREDAEKFNFVDNAKFFNLQIYKLANMYGINISTIRQNSKIFDVIPTARQAKAFVYEGNIYLNVDNATVEDPVHELMHILLGSIKYNKDSQYFNIVNSVELLPNYEELSKLYTNRTRADINEEIFVKEVSKALLGMPSELTSLSDELLGVFQKNTLFVLDTILDGDISVQAATNVFLTPLKTLAEIVLSKSMQNKNMGTINAENALKHRKVANIKELLMKLGNLIEECS